MFLVFFDEWLKKCNLGWKGKKHATEFSEDFSFSIFFFYL